MGRFGRGWEGVYIIGMCVRFMVDVWKSRWGLGKGFLIKRLVVVILIYVSVVESELERDDWGLGRGGMRGGVEEGGNLIGIGIM